jgi:prolyl oligopeptidase
MQWQPVIRKHLIVLLIVLSSSGPALARAEDSPKMQTTISPLYPNAPTSNQVDDYHGVRVADPYRPLENADAPETRAWIEAENRLTDAYLASIPQREAIRKRLSELWDFERFGIPVRKGGRYFFMHNDGLQNQSVLYTTRTWEAEPHVLLDPNTLSEDGTIALAGWSPSEDGRYLAYGLANGGSDWNEWRVRDVETSVDLDDRLEWVKFSGASWTHDGKGFFYSRYDAPDPSGVLAEANYYHKLYYHRLGTPQGEDALIYERPDQKDWGFDGSVTEDGRYLIITVWTGTEEKNRIFFSVLDDPAAGVVELLKNADAAYHFVGNDGPRFWFRTDLDAPRGRLLEIDTSRPERADWVERIPERDDTLEGVQAVGGRFAALYLRDAHSIVRIHEIDGRLWTEVTLPGLGTVGGFAGRMDDPETYYSYSSFTTPATIYRYDVRTGVGAVFKAPAVSFDPDGYESHLVFYPSKDGTRVPMFLTYRRGLVLNGDNPTLLEGYGGFNIPMTPGFSVADLVWMEMGGVYAVPCLRGGGEYGRDWHEAGMKLRKQNVFDDFIAAAEWLIANDYTRPTRLAISGGSNGGLLVGACLVQRPDLFGAAMPAVGVLDMLRFDKFTIGWAWVSDYGSPAVAEEFAALRAYSPLHNIRPETTYPPTLITTGDHDDRVVPAHSFKFAATLQAAQSGPAPILIRIETRAGHGGGKPTWMAIEEVADRWGFLVKMLAFEPVVRG